MGDVIIGAHLRDFMAEITWPWAPVFLESTPSSESLEPLMGFGFLSYPEPKLWLKNQKLGKNSTPTNADPGYILPILYMAKTCQQIELESC